MNEKKAFCTIITDNYFAWALTLYDSLYEFDHEASLYVAIIDSATTDHSHQIKNKNIRIVNLDNLQNSQLGPEITKKYSSQPNVLRWALKPILMSFCLQYSEKIIFLDADLYFFNSYTFLFDELEQNNILLTPHWRPLTPNNNRQEYEATFKHGIFNAGFVGANKNGKNALNFWAESCLHHCENNEKAGFFYDQIYLNLFPVYFDKVHIIKHQGCNVASWNLDVCKRTKNPTSSETLINNKFPIVFIHFTNVTIDNILRGEDGLLIKHLTKFNNSLVANGFKNIIESRKLYFANKLKEQNATLWEKVVKKIKLMYYKIRY